MGSGLNFLDLILEASLLVQLVMLALVAMSVMSWAIIFQRKKAISDALANAKKFEQRFWSGVDLSKLYTQIARLNLVSWRRNLASSKHIAFEAENIDWPIYLCHPKSVKNSTGLAPNSITARGSIGCR